MGSISKNDFSQGWTPSADAINAPANALLRMDNCVLDELGVVALRKGSAKINSAALSSTDVHSLFTIMRSGTRYRMAGAGSSVFANSGSIASGFTGSGDIQFGSHMGQILMARGTTKKKYDGTTVRNLGIAAPSAAPTLSVLNADSKSFASCASTESPIMTVNEGSIAFQPDKNSTANAAMELTPDATTARATATKTFNSPTDFTVYDAGQIGSNDDPVVMDVYVTEPQTLDRVILMVDVNDGTFQTDYYQYEFVNGEAVQVQLDDQQFLDSDYTAEGPYREDVLSRLEDQDAIQNTFRIDKPVTNSGWNVFSVLRGQFTRQGVNTTGKNWSTVKAVRVTFVGLSGGSGSAIRFSNIRITGGVERALTGRYKAVVVAVRNDGTYVAKSGPSAASTEIELNGQAVRATLDSTTVAALDSQVNELWLYLFGGRLKRYYRAAVQTSPFPTQGFDYTSPFETTYFTSVEGLANFNQAWEAAYAPSTGTWADHNYAWEVSGGYAGASTYIEAKTSDRAMAIANLPLETDTVAPPDSIVCIEGPHFDRMMYLTETTLYPSRQLNPDSCGTGEAVTVGNATETALWVKKLREQLFVGTTRDIYRMDGDWTVRIDGAVNVSKRPLGVTQPPISSAVAVGTVNGADVLVYLASDGWRVLQGPLLVDGAVDLLWRGYTRHGVDAVNVGSASARFRCAITKNTLFALTPEGTDTTSSDVLHAYSFGKQRWYRFVYPQALRSLYAEPDGTLISGDASGFVRTMDEATQQDDGSDIAVTVWTPSEDGGNLFTSKEPQNLLIRAETDGDAATIAFHLDGAALPDRSVTTAQTVSESGAIDIQAVSEFRQAQMRLTGSFSTFRLRGYELRYLDRPVGMLVHDTGYVDLTDSTLAWVRRLNVKARSNTTLTVQPYWDGVAGTARSITVESGREVTYPVMLGREDKGTTSRVVITSSTPSNVYWVEWEFNVSGKQRQKRVSLGATA